MDNKYFNTWHHQSFPRKYIRLLHLRALPRLCRDGESDWRISVRHLRGRQYFVTVYEHFRKWIWVKGINADEVFNDFALNETDPADLGPFDSDIQLGTFFLGDVDYKLTFHLKSAWLIVNWISRQSLQILSMYQWNLFIEKKIIQILLFSWRNVPVKNVLGIVMLLQNFMFSDFNVLLKYIVHYNQFVLVLNIAEILLTGR